MHRLIKLFLLAFIGAAVFALSACELDYMGAEDIYEKLDDIAGTLGRSQLTAEEDLAGMRNSGVDEFTGTYTAECTDTTGRDVIFGGASVKERSVRVHGWVQFSGGQLKVRVRENDEVLYIDLDDAGTFDQTLDFSGGGNYIMIDYDDFTGYIELVSEYP